MMKAISISLLVSLLAFNGCGTMSLETNSKLTRTIIIDHSQQVKKSIYVQVTNTANNGGENMNLETSIKQSLQAKGYDLASSSSEATYGLFVNVLFANNLKEAKAIKTAAGLGTTTSIVAMGSGSSTGDSLLIGATAALAGAVGAKLLEDDTFRAVIDVNVKNYVHNTNESTRVFAQAVKMNLELAEALPVLEKESTRSIVNIF
jgi:hypothetical protein